MPELLVLSKTKISMGQLQQIDDPLIFKMRILRMQSLAGIWPLQDMFYFSCKFTKNCVLAWQFTKFWVIMSQGLLEKFQFEMASISRVKLKLLRFLNGIGGMRIWFFFAGILIIGVSSSGLQRSFMHRICGTSHLAQMGMQTGTKLSSCTSKNPSIAQFSLTGGILTATLTCALSFLRILNLTSSKYSNLSLLRTEKTYSSRSLNSALLQRAMTRSIKGLEPLSSIIQSFRPIEMSNSSMEPGKRVDLPNIILARLISTKYLVSVSYVESSFSFSGSGFSVAEG